MSTRDAKGAHRDWWTAIINALLAELDGINGREGVIVLAASNHELNIDPAIRRAGRLDRTIRIPLPSQQALSEIARSYLGNDLAGMDLAPVALRLTGKTGADVEQIIRGARRRARHACRDLLPADLLAEVCGDTKQRPSRRTAIHESGHAVIAHANDPDSIVSVSAQKNGIAAGGMRMEIRPEQSTEGVIVAHIRVLLAGRAAEEVLLGDVCAGSGGPAGSDLSSATTLVAAMLLTWGLGGRLLWMGDHDADETARLLTIKPDLAAKVESRLAAEYQATLVMVRERKHLIEGLATALVDREVLSGDEVRAVLASIAEGKRAPRVVGRRQERPPAA